MYSISSLIHYVRQGNDMCQEMALQMFGGQPLHEGVSAHSEIYRDGVFSVVHYAPVAPQNSPTPLIIVPPLLNRPMILDITRERSMIARLLQMGFNVYLFDWGRVNAKTPALELVDYFERYFATGVEVVKDATHRDQVDVLSVCQSAILSMSFCALYPHLIRKLILLGAPFDFHTPDFALTGLLKYIDLPLLTNAMGVFPGVFMNTLMISLKPFEWLAKEGELIRMKDKKDFQGGYDSLKIKGWIFDNPDMPGKFYADILHQCYQQNALIKNAFKIGQQTVNIKAITTPILNIIGTRDHCVPESSTSELANAVAHKNEVTTLRYDTGHVGLMCSRRVVDDLTEQMGLFLRSYSHPNKERH